MEVTIIQVRRRGLIARTFALIGSLIWYTIYTGALLAIFALFMEASK